MTGYAAWKHERMCASKLDFPSEQLALNYATLRSWAGDEKTYRPYACQYCDQWHLTTHPDEKGTT